MLIEPLVEELGMKVASQNVRNTPDLPRVMVRAAARRVSQIKGLSVVFWQEIVEGEDHRDIQDVMGRGWSWVQVDYAIPISYKKKQWHLVETGHELMHHGLERTSPNRLVTWVVLRKVKRFGSAGSRKVVCFMNTHFVSGAWNHKEKRNKEWRQQRWVEHWVKMRDLVWGFIERGITVIFGGDWNRAIVRKFHARQRWLVSHGIDKIGVIEAPGGCRVREVRDGTVPTASDHDAVWTSVHVSVV